MAEIKIKRVFRRETGSIVQKLIDAFEDAICIQDAEKNVALARKHPCLKPAAGLYPTHLDLEKAEAMARFIREHREKLFAIGEVGLDRWVIKEPSQREIQSQIFRLFINLSMEVMDLGK